MPKKKESAKSAEETKCENTTPETADETEAAAETPGDKNVSEISAEELVKAAVAESEDKYLRLAAEYANFRSRTIKERESLAVKCVADTAKGLLPVLDNVNRAIASVQNEPDSPVKQGLELICRSINEAFEKIGIEKIETENAQFDPNLHEAVMHIDDDNLGENVIAEELQSGYKYKDTVIRHSMVKVAN